MTEERRREIRAELEQAYSYFKVADKEELNRRVESKMEDLIPGREEIIELDGQTIKGYCLTIAVGEEDDLRNVVYKDIPCVCDCVKTIVLFVNDEITTYILRTVNCYDPIGGDETLYDTPQYKIISPDQIQENFIPLLS